MVKPGQRLTRLTVTGALVEQNQISPKSNNYFRDLGKGKYKSFSPISYVVSPQTLN